MKIAVVVQSYIWGGAEVHTLQLLQALTVRKHSVELVCLDRTSAELYGPYLQKMPNVAVVQPAHTGESASCLLLWSMLRTGRRDAVVLVKGVLRTAGLLDEVLLRALGRQYISVLHCHPSPLPPVKRTQSRWCCRPRLGLWRVRLQLRGWIRGFLPDRFVCVSDSIRQRLLSDYGFNSKRTVAIRNGIDTDQFRPNDTGRAKIVARTGCAQNAFLIGTVARLCPDKALEVGLEAFRIAESRCQAALLRWVVIGEGEGRLELMRLIERYGLQNKVFLWGFCNDPSELYGGFDVFLLPSRNEGLPLTLMEAMASGCVPVATNVGGIPEVLADAGVGWLVAPESPEELADALVKAAQLNDGERDRLGLRGRRHIADHFEKSVAIGRLCEVIDGRST